MSQVLLTFDTEDFTSQNAIRFLRDLLLCLKKYEFKSVFFITGHMAEGLKDHNEITSLLEEHEIGYHSSSHSVRPTIFEFTDVESYEEAYEEALVRETSHINPLNGEVEGEGGIFAVRALCKNKEILAYRAPGFCWSPPHTEALRDIGLRFDFSSIFAPYPVFYKGLTFYPYPAVREWQGRVIEYRMFLSSILRRKVTVIGLHPNFFTNQSSWDSPYHNGNPEHIIAPHFRTSLELKTLFRSFELFLKRAKHLEQIGLAKVISDLKISEKPFTVTKEKVEEIYERSVIWPTRFFKYEPKFLRNHFFRFFGLQPDGS